MGKFFKFLAAIVFIVSIVWANDTPAGNGNTLLILQANTHGNTNNAITGSGFSRSVVELFNNGDQEVDLTGYYLHVGTNSAWTTSIPLSGTILPQHSFLITSNTVGNATPRAALPEADLEYSFALANNFRVALMKTSAITVNNPFGNQDYEAYYVDMLGVGTSTAFEGAAFSSQSSPRIPRRATLVDNNNNSTDFTDIDTRTGDLTDTRVRPNNEVLYRFWPRNSAMGAWDPISGEPRIDPVPSPWIIPDPKDPDDPIPLIERDELAGKLLIFQVFGATDNRAATHSFIELFNASDDEIDLDDITLFHTAGTGVWQAISLTGKTLPAQTSFLILGARLPLRTPTTVSPLQIEDDFGDINTTLALSNNSFRVALFRGKTELTVANPFTMDGTGGEENDGLIDFVGSRNTTSDVLLGYVEAPTRNSNSEGVRRVSFDVSTNNSTDFTAARYGDLSASQLSIIRPKNLAHGAWNPFPKEEDDTILPGTPDNLAGKLLILQAYGSSGDAAGASHSFAELYNNSNEPINLNGITLFYADGIRGLPAREEGKDSDWKAIPLSGTMQPQTSFLILGPRENTTGRLQIVNNSGDINNPNFRLSNRAFKVALIRNSGILAVQNPFTMDGAGIAEGYIDMIGAANDRAHATNPDNIFGFEGSPARNSASAAVRRSSLIDTDDNGADFASIDYRVTATTNEQLEVFRPKNRAFGRWNPVTGQRSGAAASGTLPIIFIDDLQDPQGNATIHHSSTGIWTTMTFALSDPNNPENDIAAISDQQIRGRGNSTWRVGNNKNPYRIRFRNNEQQSPFGLQEARNWVLLANWNDASLIRTSFAFEMGYRLGLECTPSFNHVELFLDGDFRGSYVLTEHRQAYPYSDRRENVRGRPLIDVNNSGWFVELDFRFDTRPISGDLGFRTANYNLPVLIKSPDFPEFPNNGVIPNSVDNFVRNDWEQLTGLMARADFPENGYRNLIDMDSWIKYFVVQVFTNEIDFNVLTYDTRANPGSVFIHRENSDSPIKAGPLWDFDNSFGALFNSFPSSLAANSLPYPNYPFFNRFLQDPVFRARWKEVWNENSEWIQEDMGKFIDSMLIEIEKSVAQDNLRWGRSAQRFSTESARMKQYFAQRFAFLDETYNNVDVLPADKEFGATPEISPQTFTLVAYGEMSNLTAILQKGNESAFKITKELTQTATRNGGYLATITIMPKSSLTMEAHADVLVLNGTNQGEPFTLNVPLTFNANRPIPDYEIPLGITAVYGQTLSDVALPNGWEWMNNAISAGNAGTHIHKAKFTSEIDVDFDASNRNYVTNSGREVSTTGYYFTDIFTADLVGRQVVVSYDVRVSDVGSSGVTHNFANAANARVGSYFETIRAVISDFERRSFVVIVPAEAVKLRLGRSGSTAEYRNVKVEIGNVATDWTPAPEDLVPYILTNIDVEVNVAKATVDKPSLVSEQFVYDGALKTVALNEVNDELYTLSGETEKTNVGDFTATVSLTDPNNYKWSGEAEEAESEPFNLNWSIICGHDFVRKTTLEANCERAGAGHYECSVCGEKKAESDFVIPALGHDHSGAAATCNTPQICARNGCEHVVTPALEHAFPETWTQRTAATCVTAGLEFRTCTHAGCTHEATRPISVRGHSLGSWTITTLATCTAAGEETRTCTIEGCGYIGERREIPRLTGDDCAPSSIRDRQQQGDRYGIIIEENPVSDSAVIFIRTPEQATITLRILDNLGNVVFAADDVRAGLKPAPTNANDNAIIWNLTNTNGRFVANGTYLIVVEATGISGRRFTYSARIGVNR